MLKLKDETLLKADAYVGGAWTPAGKGARFAVRNPATGEELAQVADLDAADAQKAIAHALVAWRGWRSRTAKERGGLMRKWFELIMGNQEDLARIMTAEQGKPLAETRGEVAYGANFIEWFAEEGKRVYGDVIPTFAQGKRVLVFKEPVGVVAAITPWNFPNAMITRKAAPALAAGCTFLIKPPSETPLSALALAVLAERAGIPAGVFNVVTSDKAAEVGREFTESPMVRKFSFTGSTEIGKLLMRQSASTVKKVSLELGGNAPFIVFDDADLDAAVEGAMASKYRNMGQTCVCANRLLVQDGVYEAFEKKLAERVGRMKLGNGMDDGVTQGPLINEDAVEKVERLLRDATAKGAKIAMGGKRSALGYTFFEPTIVTEATPAMDLARQEIFGPVAPLFRFKTETEAIQMANDTEFGLAAYFYTRDVGRTIRVAEALEYGIVGINEGIISSEAVPFGGMKESGIGREGGKYGIEDYLEIKYVLLGGIGPRT
ncbi:MAG: NAD-dependent succinate-semialdehyde dehydrogenase [Alphaproteobacteria bacterium]|nr:NAD-dependent succinate-semialdehyde dehydrogenase [Alphaproteobacteria bacterium]MBL6937166.1 NAD-dependent succinate-semialdehyde dehydrogenase [Alphaproteobacteria bacterium]MBL7096272.1 NAD-dependent succinate-semialdehyde dehydrogenase [Alphaproteobacteria bacterium]